MEQNLEQPNQPNPQQEESIFDESEILGSGYDKHIKKARNALFIIAGVEVLSGFLTLLQTNHADPVYIWIEVLFIAAIFVGLGFWTKSKPFTAIMVGLVIFVAYQVFYMILDPTNIIRGIILKIIIVVYLITGLKNAQEAKRIKEALGNK